MNNKRKSGIEKLILIITDLHDLLIIFLGVDKTLIVVKADCLTADHNDNQVEEEKKDHGVDDRGMKIEVNSHSLSHSLSLSLSLSSFLTCILFLHKK